jgi:hypothetical protein
MGSRLERHTQTTANTHSDLSGFAQGVSEARGVRRLFEAFAMNHQVGMVLAAARALLFVREVPKQSNAGQGVEAMLKVCGLGPGHPWCAAFTSYVGRSALGSLWPLPLTAGCAALGEAAKAKGILVNKPLPGDVFLVWFPKLGRYGHTGFIVSVGDGVTHQCIEGNTNDGGSRDGWGVFERPRTFGPKDRFIRWQHP